MFVQAVDRECDVGDDGDGRQRARTRMSVGAGILVAADEDMTRNRAFDVRYVGMPARRPY
jgi:hypothetical protein